MTKTSTKSSTSSLYNDIYVLRVKGHWSCYWPREEYPITVIGEKGEPLDKFITAMKKLFEENFKIEPKFRNIRNEGVENYIKEQLLILNLVNYRSKEI